MWCHLVSPDTVLPDQPVLKEMMDSVQRGHAFTIYDRAGEPMAMILPWASWSNINRRLITLDEVENILGQIDLDNLKKVKSDRTPLRGT